MSSSKDFFIDIIVSAAPKFVGKLKGIFLIPIITKIMGQEAYGVWTNFAIAVTLFAAVSSLNLGASANKYLANAREREVSARYSALILTTCVPFVAVSGGLIVLQDLVFSFIFGNYNSSSILYYLIVSIFLNQYTNVSIQLLRSQRQISVYSIISVTRSIGEIGAVGLGVLWFNSIKFSIILVVVFQAILSLLILSYIYIHFGIRKPKFYNIEKYIRFGFPLIVSGVMYWLVSVSDRYLITYFHTIDITGGYAVVYAAAGGLGAFSTAIGTVLFPDLSALRANNDVKEYRQRLSSVIKYYLIVTIPAAVGLAVIAGPLLRLLSTASISEYTDLIFMLAPAMVTYGLINILIQALLSDGRSQVSALIWGIIAVLNLGANVVLVPRYAAVGASVTTLGSFVVGLAVVVLWKRNDIRISFILLGKVLVVSIIMGGIVVLVRSLVPVSDVVALPVLVGTGVLVYMTLGFMSGFLTRQDVEFVLETM